MPLPEDEVQSRLNELRHRIDAQDADIASLDKRLQIADGQRLADQAAIDKRFKPLEDLFALFKVFGGAAGPVLRWLGPIILGLGSALIATWAAWQRAP